jgi:hypothetical protein
MPITPKTGSLFHAETQAGDDVADVEPQLGRLDAGDDAALAMPGPGGMAGLGYALPPSGPTGQASCRQPAKLIVAAQPRSHRVKSDNSVHA